MEQSGNIAEASMEGDAELPAGFDDLCALERAVEKEWWWLAGALRAVAEIRAEIPLTPIGRFRELQAQKLNLDRKRVEIAGRVAGIMGPGKTV